MPKGKRQGAAGASSAQPAKFGIQHFFARHAASSSQQPTTCPTPQIPSDSASRTKSLVSSIRDKTDEDTVTVVETPSSTRKKDVKQRNEGGGRSSSKRVKLSPTQVLPQTQQTQDDGEEIVWKASPAAERWSGKEHKRLALHPCQSGNANVKIASPRSKISPGIGGKLKTWLSSSTCNKEIQAANANKENDACTQVTMTQKLQALTPNAKARKRVFDRQAKRMRNRKVLFDLLDRVESAISDDKAVSGDETSAVEASSDETEQRTSPCNELQQCQDAGANNGRPNIHYLVLEVTDSQYHKEGGHALYPEKVVRLLDEANAVERLVYLRDEWTYSVIRPGDTVNVIGDFELDGKCVIDHERNLLILHPDVLISGSRVGSSFSCPRRAVLDERIKSPDTSMAALLGTMLHKLFQTALTAENPSFDFLQAHARTIVTDHIDGLYAVDGDEKEALAKLVEAIPLVLEWLCNYKAPQISPGSNIDFGLAQGKCHVSISEVVDIEEMIWSPKYGLKGMIDASLRLDDEYMPLEFKTGKATTGQAAVEHRAQVILYTLLMSDRYSQDVNRGILYYLNAKETQGIPVQHADLTGLLIRRNEHAGHLLLASSTQTLPPMLQSSYMCRGCRMVDVCSVYHKLQEGGTAETSGLGDHFDVLTSHLSRKHGEFLQHWEHLVDLEAQVQHSAQSGIWRAPSVHREERGRCLSSMIITASSNDRERFIYCFSKAAEKRQKASSCVHEEAFSLGDYVLLSTESGHVAVAGGIVKNINAESVTISISHVLTLPGRKKDDAHILKELWRIDKDDRSSSFAIMRYNILQLFVRDGAKRSRELIVDLEAPKFDNIGMVTQDPAAAYVQSIAGLNRDQRSAIGKILSARDYALVLGMPGTGKTSTIVHAVRALLARGSSVLLASYTNSAVDNILLKLKCQNVDFLRVGRPDAIHPELVEHAVGTDVTSVDDLKLKIQQARVVGATCLGITHALFTKRKFDVCIIDEAGQITLPVCLGPLRYAHTFILVGDHYQLPPLIQNAEAREKGMAISLFRRLSEAHPQAVTALQCQYRMCSDIMKLSNVLIYGNRLRCGSTEIANGRLHVNVSASLSTWTLQVLDAARSVVFLDMDKISFQAKRHASAKQNIAEASVLMNIVRSLSQGGVSAHSIGVISPYKSQVDYIKRRLIDTSLSDIEVNTIDKYQGRDKDCILVSFVLSQHQRVSGSLLNDWHRINVAITRAKTKLIMIGSVKALSSVPLLKLLIQQVEEQGGLVELPDDALTSL